MLFYFLPEVSSWGSCLDVPGRGEPLELDVKKQGQFSGLRWAAVWEGLMCECAGARMDLSCVLFVCFISHIYLFVYLLLGREREREKRVYRRRKEDTYLQHPSLGCLWIFPLQVVMWGFEPRSWLLISCALKLVHHWIAWTSLIGL